MSNGAEVSLNALLIQRCLNNDNDAWNQLRHEYKPFVRAVIGKFLEPWGSPAYLIEELSEGLWVDLWEHQGRRLRAYDPARPLAPFLAKLATDFVCRCLRAERRHRAKRRSQALTKLADLTITEYSMGLVLHEVDPQLSPRLQQWMQYRLSGDAQALPGLSSLRNVRMLDTRLRRKLQALFGSG